MHTEKSFAANLFLQIFVLNQTKKIPHWHKTQPIVIKVSRLFYKNILYEKQTFHTLHVRFIQIEILRNKILSVCTDWISKHAAPQ